MGDYSWTSSDTKEGVNLLDGLRLVCGNKIQINYAEGCDWWSQDTTKIAEAVEKVSRSDIAIVAIGTRSTYLGRSPENQQVVRALIYLHWNFQVNNWSY